MRDVSSAIAAIAAMLVLAVPGAFAETAAPAAVQREELGNRISENLPAIPRSLLERLNQYQNTRDATFVGWLDDGGLLISTRFGETHQVHRVRAPLAMREQLTYYSEPVMMPAVPPAQGADGFVFGRDVGGSEFWQLYWFDLQSRETRLLTDGGRSRNSGPVWSRDGLQFAYSSTARNGKDSDIWLRELGDSRSRPVLTEGGTWFPSDFSPDGKSLLVMQYVSINDVRPGVVNLDSGALRMFPVEGGAAFFGRFVFAPDGKAAYFISDEGSEFRTLRHHEFASDRITVLSADIPWDVQDFRLSDDGRRLAFVVNEDGIGRLRVLSLSEKREIPVPQLPLGAILLGDFVPDGTRLALTLRPATEPADVHVVDLETQSLARWSRSEVGGLDPASFIAPELIRYPTFDQVGGQARTIPAFYYRPRGRTDSKHPVIIQIHGGPESQAFPVFDPNIQFIASELGAAVLVPNVRGSAGYGKSYLLLDNGRKREDSVKDIGALLDWIAAQPELDASRVGVFGGSYGGYMVLASMTHYNDRLKAGVDIVGISNFVTFLENTETYRRDLRRAEYGDERDPEMRAFLQQISPLNNAHKISIPLFVAQGANDPRVPASEGEQIVSKVRGQGGQVWYLLFKDEGHGFRKKTNRDYFSAATMMFWQRHLIGESE
jgi:VCBS repeat-containing protein